MLNTETLWLYIIATISGALTAFIIYKIVDFDGETE
jgi:glycerol uptake facilitator-like aquaporin